MEKRETTAGWVAVDREGICRVTFRPGHNVSAVDIEEMHRVLIDDIAVTMPVLIDTRALASMSREARERAAADYIAEHVTRLAVLRDGPISTVIINFVVRLGRPKFPLRVFSSEAEAVNWLSSAE